MPHSWGGETDMKIPLTEDQLDKLANEMVELDLKMNAIKNPPLNPDYKNATHDVWFHGLHPRPVELGGDGITGPYIPIQLGKPPVI
jgi:hypothetical protein